MDMDRWLCREPACVYVRRMQECQEEEERSEYTFLLRTKSWLYCTPSRLTVSKPLSTHLAHTKWSTHTHLPTLAQTWMHAEQGDDSRRSDKPTRMARVRRYGLNLQLRLLTWIKLFNQINIQMLNTIKAVALHETKALAVLGYYQLIKHRISRRRSPCSW